MIVGNNIIFNMTTSPASNKAGKVLTDFSIQTIIGNHPRDTSRNNSTNNDNNSFSIIKNDDSLAHRLTATAAAAAAANTTTTTMGHKFNRGDPNQCNPTIRKYRPKNFICPACEMAFSNNGQLKTHVRIHTGERPFMCNHPDCNKTFTRNEELTRHKLIHTGDRPHSCSTCGKRFGRKDHLKKHSRTHDRKKLREVFDQERATYVGNEDLFVSPKRDESTSDSQSTDRFMNVAPPPYSPSLNRGELANLIPPATSDPHPGPASSMEHHFLPSHHLPITTAMNIASTMQVLNTSTNPIDVLASEYWNVHNWYNLMGFYHHQIPLNLSTG